MHHVDRFFHAMTSSNSFDGLTSINISRTKALCAQRKHCAAFNNCHRLDALQLSRTILRRLVAVDHKLKVRSSRIQKVVNFANFKDRYKIRFRISVTMLAGLL